MTDPFELRLNTGPLDATLDVIARAGNLASLTPKLAVELLSQTEANFRAQGQPKWPALSKRTIAQREKKGRWPGPILQVTGALARAVITDSGPNYAAVGVAGYSHQYAAIQQFGGKAGRYLATTIPARPYLPMDKDGRISPQAEHGLLQVTYVWLGFVIR
jgi:phage virion morphogenesis protein